MTYAFQSGCVGNYCFNISDYITSEYNSQTDAQQWCEKNGSQLAEIVSQDVQDAVETFLGNLPVNASGRCIRTGGMRSSGNWSRLSGRTMDNSNCSDGRRMSDGQCYKYFNQTEVGLSWYDARNQCLNRGGDLASFDYITSNDGFRNLNTSWLNTSDSYWIGIRQEFWTWQTSDIKYSNWLNNEPGSSSSVNCLCLSNNPPFKWFAFNCYDATPLLCVSDSRKSFSLMSPTSSISTLPISFEPHSSQPDSNSEAKIGIGVGVGVGGFLLIVVVIVVIFILIKKRRLSRPRSKTRYRNEESTIAVERERGAEENTVYAKVLQSPEANKKEASNMQQQPPTVYQELDIVKNDSQQSQHLEINSPEMD